MIAVVTGNTRTSRKYVTLLSSAGVIRIRQLIRYVCKFVDTWAHSYWAVKYDSPINNDNLGRPIMPKLLGHGRAKVEQWLAHAPTKFNVGSRHRADKTFFPTGKFIALGDRRHRILTEISKSRLQRIGCETCCKNQVKNGLAMRGYFVTATFFWFFWYFFDDGVVVELTIFSFFLRLLVIMKSKREREKERS